MGLEQPQTLTSAPTHLPTGVSSRLEMPPTAVSKPKGCVGPGIFAPSRGFFQERVMVPRIHGASSRSCLTPALSSGGGSALSLSRGTVPVCWLALSGRPQGRGLCPWAMPSALPGLAPSCGIVLLCPCPSQMILLGSWT
ncbi:hypothetical protein DV515_00006243 [Chloebia gouldiae]|uniref:Uncharacterized protein n=1 Tax=Chloebia gouldiae TaxID=44316 RepID=A0A3L8SKN2_CHLGU|nr:hypothetical protein DV515_00006243 [Chloebia gouldiae]